MNLHIDPPTAVIMIIFCSLCWGSAWFAKSTIDDARRPFAMVDLSCSQVSVKFVKGDVTEMITKPAETKACEAQRETDKVKK